MIKTYDFKEISKGILLAILRPNVISSVYSNSFPTAIPLAIVEVLISPNNDY